MDAKHQFEASDPRKGAPDRRSGAPGWVMPSGRRLIEFVIAGGLAAPVLALALRHVVRAERRRKKAQSL
jgi:hypothetical protein